MTIKDKIKQLPSSPGVYLMKDAGNNLIYIGKSKNLKSRVGSYFQSSRNQSPKIEKLVSNIRDLDYIVTDTELEALLLESELIKRHQPIFNRMMKNPQLYCYVEIRISEEYPSIKIVSSADHKNHIYFGPYQNRGRVELALQGLKEFLQIDCSAPANQQGACLNYSLGLCMGICLGGETVKKNLQHSLERMLALLNGTNHTLLEEMKEKMVHASESFDFETAAKYRDYVDAVHSVLQKNRVVEFAKEQKKTVVIEPLNEDLFKLFLIVGDRVLFKKTYLWDGVSCSQMKADILSNFCASPFDATHDVQKKDVDRAQILYSYLQNAKYWAYVEDKSFLEDKDGLDKILINLMKKAVDPIE